MQKELTYLDTCRSEMVGELVEDLQPGLQFRVVLGVHWHVPRAGSRSSVVQGILGLLICELVPGPASQCMHDHHQKRMHMSHYDMMAVMMSEPEHPMYSEISM